MKKLQKEKLKALKLSGIIKSFNLRMKKAIKNNYTYQEFFEILIKVLIK
ncbi:hypothetical protein [Caldicellulosiruptor morganii]|nr:hypothetical protein [Caldicellulosiruptor morganii]